MNVFIFGGKRTDYLQTQIASVRKWCSDPLVHYIQGPLHRFAKYTTYYEALPSDVIDIRILDTEVRPTSCKHVRLWHMIRYCMRTCGNEVSLFLHGDCIPFARVDVRAILDGRKRAAARNFNLQWFLTADFEDSESFNLADPDLLTYRIKPLLERQWRELSAQPFKAIQLYEPCFVHLDDYSMDDSEAIEIKQEACRELLR